MYGQTGLLVVAEEGREKASVTSAWYEGPTREHWKRASGLETEAACQ